MSKKRIWFFGDSWVCTYTGWIKELVEKNNLEVKNYGVAGASIQNTLVDISAKKHDIQPEDIVVVCYTATTRFYLNSKNFCTVNLDITGKELQAGLDYHKITQEEHLAFVEFAKVVGIEDIAQLNLFALKTLHNYIVPKLSNNTVELFGFEPTAPPVKRIIDFLDINYNFEKYPPLFKFITDNNTDYTESVIHIPDSLTEKFFNTYGTLFKLN